MEHQSIYIFSGPIGSGKSTLSKLFAEQYNIPRVSFGDLVRKKARSRGVDSSSRSELQALGQQLIDQEFDTFCAEVVEAMLSAPDKCGVIDGLRHNKVHEHLRAAFADFTVSLIYIDADEDIRFRRLESLWGWSSDECVFYDQNSTEVEVKGVIKAKADLIVDNSGSVEESAAAILEWVKSIATTTIHR